MENLEYSRNLFSVGEVIGDNRLIPTILNVLAKSLSVDLGNGKKTIIPLVEIYYPCLHQDFETLHTPWAEWATEQSVTARIDFVPSRKLLYKS